MDHDFNINFYHPVWKDGTSGKRSVNYNYGVQLVLLNQKNLICTHVTMSQLEAAGYSKDHIVEIYARVQLQKGTQ